MSRLAPLVAFAVALVAAGCSGASEPELPRPGATALYLESRVTGACEVTRVALGVDGQFLYKMVPPDIPPAGAHRRLVAKIPLAPGSHALSIQATAQCKGVDSEPEIVTIRDARSFFVTEAPAAVVIEINSSRLANAKTSQLDAKLYVRGAELAPAIGPEGTIYEGGEVDAAGVDDRLCTGLPPARRAICRAEAVLTRARDRKDVVSVGCIQDKIHHMRQYNVTINRATERMRGARAPSPAGAGEAVQAHDSAVIALAEQRIQALAAEIEYCIGHEAMDPHKGSGVRVLEKP
jgi:hypothetical protein